MGGAVLFTCFWSCTIIAFAAFEIWKKPGSSEHFRFQLTWILSTTEHVSPSAEASVLRNNLFVAATNQRWANKCFEITKMNLMYCQLYCHVLSLQSCVPLCFSIAVLLMMNNQRSCWLDNFSIVAQSGASLTWFQCQSCRFQGPSFDVEIRTEKRPPRFVCTLHLLTMFALWTIDRRDHDTG